MCISYHNSSILLWLLLLIFLLPIQSQAGGEIRLVSFVPVSQSATDLLPRHPRVLTEEFLSNATTLEGAVSGEVVPQEYLQLLHENLLAKLQAAGFEVHLFEQLADAVTAGKEYLIFGAVERITVARGGTLIVNLRLVDVDSGQKRGETRFKRELNLPKTPYSIGYPVHMVGLHKDNFHPQRMVLNYLASQIGDDVAAWVKGVTR